MLGLVGRAARSRSTMRSGSTQFHDVPFIAGERPTAALAPMAHLRIARAMAGGPWRRRAESVGRPWSDRVPDPAPGPRATRSAPLAAPASACVVARLRATHCSMRSTSSSNRSSAAGLRAGSSQSMSSAAFRLERSTSVSAGLRDHLRARAIARLCRTRHHRAAARARSDSTYPRCGQPPATATNPAPPANAASQTSPSVSPARWSAPAASDRDHARFSVPSFVVMVAMLRLPPER